ncbi:DUF2490 domain-containing protein [Legionella spiritensis]|uniref:DUF2490 domain-containing protein n=1 Tax=Legionella spiritensis TaxID=452 RepID=UPI000F712257|nr:DUF2490 domain-containing protein [Legionella spiritensis]VEG91829.1 Protein of uncharacterised function (DUF2490) [Legionella spiritensis]
MFFKRICLAMLAFIMIRPIYALPTHDYQIWSNITTTGHLNHKIKYWLETQERFGSNASRLSQMLARPGIGYVLSSHSSLWLGYAWIYTTFPFASSSFDENRIWQQFLWSRDFTRLKFIGRTRLEQRFIQNAVHTAWRFRQLTKIEIPLQPQSKFNFISSDEVFIHLNNFNNNNNQGMDQNRFFVGLGYKPGKNILMEIGYLNQIIVRSGSSNYTGHSLSLNLFLNY